MTSSLSQLLLWRSKFSGVALLSLICALCFPACIDSALIAENQLLDQLRASGTYEIFIDKKCDACVRGAFAARDFREGATVARVVLGPSTAVELGPADSWETPWALARRIYDDTAFNATLGSFWETQPKPEDTFNMETFTEDEIELLQSEELAQTVRSHTATHRSVYESRDNASIAAAAISFEEYLYLGSLLTSRSFSIPDDPNNETSLERSWLIAGIDMINSVAPFNIHRVDTEPGVVEIVAIADIKQGEELTKEYSSQSHRNDVSLLVYGFVQERDPPLLCSLDLWQYDSSQPWQDTAMDDSALEDLSRSGAATEMGRLLARLDSLPTTEEEDRELLAQARAVPQARRNWRREMILSFRVARKRALRHWIRRLSGQIGEL